MIISDEDDTQKIKDPPLVVPTVRYPEPAASRPLGSLPDYETSQALAFRDVNDSQVTLYKPPPRRHILDSRFWRAALVSLVVYIFLTLVIGVPIIVHKEYEDQPKYPPYNALSYALAWSNKSSGGFNHSGGTNISSPVEPGIFPTCNNWTTVQYRDGDITPIVLATTENVVSANGQFSFSSNASCDSDVTSVQGAFYAGINPNETIQDAILSIIMQSSSPGIFSQTSVCFAATDNFTDLSLYVPGNMTSTDNILYNITLLFPQTAIASRVDSLTTFLPMFDQRFGSFDGNVNFNRVSIQGPASRVTADLLQADRLLVDTSLEPVTGTFYAQHSLQISTIMAPIAVNISLFNDPKSPLPTLLDVHTGNSNLTANVTVMAPNSNPPLRPNFITNLRTFSGTLSATVSHDPMSAPTAIDLRVVNDLGPTTVVLDSFFEGFFQVSTKQASVTVSQGNASVTNPWAPELARTMVLTNGSAAQSAGWIGWGVAQPELSWDTFQQGEAVIESSLADVALSFLG